jgi:outer membrane lipoprotein-sorting protein
MKYKTALILVICLFQQLQAQQSAKDILDKVSNTYSTKTGFVLSFTLNTEDTNTKTTYSHDGKAYIKGNKFKIETPDGTTWFDGKTQWVYMEGSGEVNVSEPDGEELAAISPVALLNMYKSGFRLSNKKQKTENGKTLHVVEMLPQKKGGEITKIIVSVDASTGFLASIVLQGKDRVNNRLTIRKHEKIPALSDNTFVFDRHAYPDVEIVDLR